ncbi:diguanylate cyclase [Devosia sp.]|uniref:diguanylate cyclase n=1 Tax=Devosia sp. TaxID=1871048 RepID=UPI003265C7A4
MTTLWQTLIGNLAVVALFFSGWIHTRHWLNSAHLRVRSAVFGLCMGGAAIASMLMAVQLRPGVFFDLRVATIAVSAFFGGPYAGVVTALTATVFRAVSGGDGLLSALVGMVLAAAVGLGGYFLLGPKEVQPRQVAFLGVAVVVINFISMALLPAGVADAALARLGPAVAVINFVATVLVGLVLVQLRRTLEERNLLVAALGQAPDYTYVKNRRSEFAAVNEAVAGLHHFSRPADMIGRTDFDLTDWSRAQELFLAEQRVMNSGESLIDFEENLSDAHGVARWFSTSKVPLRDGGGTIIGLAGVTRDVTADKQLRGELTGSRNQLSFALTEMSDGLAMFDSSGFLVFSNERYRQCFPLTADARRPGAHIRDILVAVVETGEQITVPHYGTDQWVDEIAASLHADGEEEIHLFDGSWLLLRTKLTTDGASMVVVSDVTKIKHAEIALLEATEQLKLLASTDGLTGLINRRSFDQAIEIEIARSIRSQHAISVLMIDVDRFKLYNDRYGHPTGDECLRAVSQCLRNSVRHSADVVARYGGEEFVAILPDTDEAGALVVAEEFRKQLAGLAIPHEASERGVVTASIGVSSYAAGEYLRYSPELIAMADKALYAAKAGGRDRISIWRPIVKRGKASIGR